MKQGVPQILISRIYSSRSPPKTPIFSLKDVVGQCIRCWHVGLLLVYTFHFYSLQRLTSFLDLVEIGSVDNTFSDSPSGWMFYRKTIKQDVEKRSFPTLLKKFWDTKLSLHLVSGFKGRGIWPFGRSIVDIENCVTEVEFQGNGVTAENWPNRIRKIPRKTIAHVTAPQSSAETQVAVGNAKKQRKRLQAKEDEVLTNPAVLEQLREEAEARSAKNNNALKRTNKSLHFDNKENKNSDESEDEDIHEASCIMSNWLWRKNIKKRKSVFFCMVYLWSKLPMLFQLNISF